ncbi:MAG TPA: efflux RND transporter permease subunit, partial [Polyangiaceae bacterium]|nr:efflux RND transporter permease subunit [Polyangiaceae bacterium]
TRQNVDLPAGRVEGSATDMGLRTVARLTTPAEFESLTIKTVDGRIIEFQDVGRAILSAEDVRSSLKMKGKPMIGVAVIPQPNTNAIAIADEFYKRLEGIKQVLPPEYSAEIGFDFTTYVRSSIAEVEETLLLAFVLVAFIIFVFLRDLRATIIPVIAIPVSIVSAFFIMYLLGYSINILTLVGLVLAIGLVCDDAIVVLENIYSKIERGQPPLQAALTGSKEIYFAVISTTISLAAVFLPILFLSGVTGRLFKEFGVVVAGSILVSAFVALTLSPMMCRFLLKHRERPGRLHAATEPFFRFLTRSYQASLRGFMSLRVACFPLIAVIAGYVLWQGPKLPRELAPLEDRSNIRINVRAPESAGYEFTAAQIDRVGVWIDDNIPEIARSYSIAGTGGRAVN